MTTSKQSQPAAGRRGELHRANGDRQVGQAIGARRRLNVLPLRAGLNLASENQPGARPRTRTALAP